MDYDVADDPITIPSALPVWCYQDYAEHPNISLMMKMMMLHHHHTYQQESMLQTDFVVAFKSHILEELSPLTKQQNQPRKSKICSKKADIKILAIIAKKAKLQHTQCHATMNTILKKHFDCISLRIKFDHMKLCFIVFFSNIIL